MGRMKEQLPAIEVRYVEAQPQTILVDEVYLWAVSTALQDTDEKHDEGVPTYMKRVKHRALYLLSMVRELQDNIDATDDNGDLD